MKKDHGIMSGPKQAGTGKVPDGPSTEKIDAKTVDVDEFGRREGFTKRTYVTLAKDPDFGPGLAGGSAQRFYEIRRKQMQRQDWGRPSDANEDELPRSEKHDARGQDYEDAKDAGRYRGENPPKTKTEKDY